MTAPSAVTLEVLVAEPGDADTALAVGCDVCDQSSQRTVAETMPAHLGRNDAMFANAGIGGQPD